MNQIINKLKLLNPQWIILFVLLLLFVGFNIYWTKLRPTFAAKDCAKVAIANSKGTTGLIKSLSDYEKVYNIFFERCMLVGYGIKK